MTKFEQLPNTITHLGKTYKLKIRQMTNGRWQIYYCLHTNDKHEPITVLFLPYKLFTWFKDEEFMPLSTANSTKEKAINSLLNKLNKIDRDWFTWK